MDLARGTGRHRAIWALGPYRLFEPIGRGGMAVVYRAEHVALCRDVAIKVLSEEAAARSSVRRQFLREARIAASLDHPNIVTIHDYAQDPSGIHYMAMELLAGDTLGQVLDVRGPLSLSAGLSVCRPLADAMAYIHAADLTHGDLKAENVVLCPTGDRTWVRPKLIDFGISRATQHDREISTVSQVVGTPRVMAPEVIRGRLPEQPADVWSFGVLLHEMFCERGPFAVDENDPLAVLHRVIETDPEPPDLWLPDSMRELISACLSKRASHRPQMVEVCDRLSEIAHCYQSARHAVDMAIEDAEPLTSYGPAFALS